MSFVPRTKAGATVATGDAGVVPLEPELAGFQREMGDFVRREVGDDPTVGALRRASRAARIGWSLAGPEVPATEIEGLGMAARLYRPPGAELAPVLVYLHGGGWTMLDLDTHDRLMGAYAIESGWCVLGLDYPLAPEIQFPDSLTACAVAVERFVSRAASLGVRGDRVVLGGDSSGANLALCIELARAKSGLAPSAGLLLNYGVFDSDLERISYRKFGDAPYLLTRQRMEFFWSNYCRDAKDRTDPQAAPMRLPLVALGALPPVYMTIAAQDVLADENRVFAQKLSDAGVSTTRVLYENAAHGFLEAVHCSPLADRAIKAIAVWLGGIMGRDPGP